MRLASILAGAAVILSTAAGVPAAADPGRGHGKHDQGRHQYDLRPAPAHVANCPPGLARKNPPCVPPGHARKQGYHVGDIFRTGGHVVIRDPRRFDLEPRRGWSYYRDDSRIYRVDSDTRRVLAVLNLIGAFGN